MQRKEFLKSCGLLAISPCILSQATGMFRSASTVSGPTTPCEEKEEFAQKWVKRFFDNFDKHLAESTREGIMQDCGRDCFRGSIGGRKPNPIDADELIRELNKYAGEIAATRDGNEIDFQYVKNSRGLKIADGYCLCPSVESGPPGLSGTYCECSVGYVKEMFETYTGKQVHVGLVESLKRGGKRCRFKVTLSS